MNCGSRRLVWPVQESLGCKHRTIKAAFFGIDIAHMLPTLLSISALAAYDATCCAKLASHRAARTRRNVTLPDGTVSLVSAAAPPLKCVRTPVPSMRCSLVLPKQMLCCHPEDEVPERRREHAITMEAVEREHCHCDAAEAADDATSLSAPGQRGKNCDAVVSAGKTCSAGGAQTCTATDSSVNCEYQCTYVADGHEVLFSLPAASHPRPLPVVLMFECWNSDTTSNADLIPTLNHFHGCAAGEYDANYVHANLTRTLLEAGYAVVAPRARDPTGGTYGRFWDTNMCCSVKGPCDHAPYASPWHPARFDDSGKYETCDMPAHHADPPAASKWLSESLDARVASAVMGEIGKGREGVFGADLDASRVHAVGFSSGGFMASRMAATQDGQSGRLGEAIAGLHGLVSLRLKAWGCPPHSRGEANCLKWHSKAVAFHPEAAQVDDFAAFDHSGDLRTPARVGRDALVGLLLVPDGRRRPHVSRAAADARAVLFARPPPARAADGLHRRPVRRPIGDRAVLRPAARQRRRGGDARGRLRVARLVARRCRAHRRLLRAARLQPLVGAQGGRPGPRQAPRRRQGRRGAARRVSRIMRGLARLSFFVLIAERRPQIAC